MKIQIVRERAGAAWRWIRQAARTGWEWRGRQWAAMRPGPEVPRAFMAGTTALFVAWVAFVGTQMRLGFGPWIDGASGAVAGALLLGLAWLLMALAMWIVRRLPLWTSALALVAAGMIGIMWPSSWISGAALVLTAAGMASTCVSLWRGGYRQMPWQRKAATIAILAILVSFTGVTIWFLIRRGNERDLVDAPLSKQPRIASLNLPDPSLKGPYKVIATTYGPGTDKRRPEYGPQGKGRGVGLKSRTVDGSKVFKSPEGWRGKLYGWYWGFDSKKMPLNARLWYPEGSGPFPVVLVVHGNHLAQDFSDPGYAYLGEMFASRGYIFASIDENFINSSWTGGLDEKETAARGWLLLEHLRLFREWNSTKGHALEGKVDLDKIALMGHSRGGEAAATATAFNPLPAFPDDATQKFDYNFHIRSVIAIAPADGQYKPAGVNRPLRDVNYFVIHGGYDGDVSAFIGSRQFNRTTLSDSFPGFKSELWIYRANHGQFNTVWGDTDNGPPYAWFLNRKPLLSGEDQRRIARVYFSAFLEATLLGRDEYRALFRDYRCGAPWLPDATYVNRYADSNRTVVVGFDEDFNVETATLAGAHIKGDKLAVWKERRAELRWDDRGDNAVYLGWREPAATYTIELPPEFAARLTPDTLLSFDYADTNDNPPKPDEDKDKRETKDSKKKAEKKDEKKSAEKDKKKTDKEDDKKRKEPLDFTVELLTADGRTARLTLGQIGPLYKPFIVHTAKLYALGFGPDSKETEAVLQRYAVRIGAFPGLASAQVKEIRFRFDKSKEGVVLMDNIAFEGLQQAPPAKPSASPKPAAAAAAAY